jgi:hypothetical protein
MKYDIYDIKYNLMDNIKNKVKCIRITTKKYVKKIQRFRKSPPTPKIIEPIEVIWDNQGRWKWNIETRDRVYTLDDDYNPFGEEWDDEEIVV